ncbi:MAG TPA: MarR family transcriptional regulator [Acidimicrobiales bacterium]|jgi:DNA-binding MarR family transcriptional regulator|nr:MarR family transcriptional regulator [Acidimicrobiales bacterium]
MSPRKPPPSPAPDTLSDPVDWAKHYWEQQGLEGDELRFLAMSSLMRYQRIVVDTIEEQLRRLGINTTDYLLLMTLQLSESGTRVISGLARSLMVHPTTATLATDRLEAKGLLRRTPHPTDRRATCVTITDDGRRLVHDTTIALGEVEFGLIGASGPEVNRLMSVLSQLRTSAGDTGRSKARPVASAG